MAAHVVRATFQAKVEIARVLVDADFVIDIVKLRVHTCAAEHALATVAAVRAVGGAGTVFHSEHIVLEADRLAAAVLAGIHAFFEHVRIEGLTSVKRIRAPLMFAYAL